MAPSQMPALPRLGADGTALPPHATTEQILRHPRFPLARDHYMRAMVNAYQTDPAIRRLLHEAARSVLFNIILGQNARSMPDDPASWLTVGRLRDSFIPFGLASPRSFDQMLARLQVIGMIDLAPAPGDRRRRLVVPTPRMIEEDLVWLADHMSPLAVLFPERDDYRPAMRHDREHQIAQRIISTYHYAGARDILNPEDPVRTLLLRQDAAKILFIYLLAAQPGPGGCHASVSYEAAAARLSTSRTHVRNLLSDLQSHGLLMLHGRGGVDVEITPQLWDLVGLFLAEVMSGHDLVWQIARRMVATKAIAT